MKRIVLALLALVCVYACKPTQDTQQAPKEPAAYILIDEMGDYEEIFSVMLSRYGYARKEVFAETKFSLMEYSEQGELLDVKQVVNTELGKEYDFVSEPGAAYVKVKYQTTTAILVTEAPVISKRYEFKDEFRLTPGKKTYILINRSLPVNEIK